MMRIGRVTVGTTSPFFASAVHFAFALLVVAGGSSAFAETGYYVTPDGRRYAMTRSTTEYAVVVRSDGKASASSKRLEESSLGRIDRFEDFPRGSVYRLTTSEVSPKRSSAVLRDPDIVAVHPVYRFAENDAPVIATGQIIVKFAAKVTADERETLFRKYALGVLREMTPLKGVYVVQPLLVDRDVEIAEQLSYDERIVWANPNLIVPTVPTQVSASDEFFSKQWHHQNLGDEDGVVDADIDTPEAWEISTGAGVLIGMIDEGVDVDHEDLVDRYFGSGDDLTIPFFEDDAKNPRPKRFIEAHGTAVAGLMVASANTKGVRGVAPSAMFRPSRGISVGASVEQLANGFLFAGAFGVDVHNNSWGFPGGIPNPPVIVDAIQLAFQEGRDGLGMVILFAAGNENTLNELGLELSTLPEVIGVGASNRSDRRSVFSSFGPDIDILAPGGSGSGDITTTDNTDNCCFFDDNGEPTTNPDDLVTAAYGYNFAGRSRIPEFALDRGVDFDPTGSYTGTFNGTSAACPIASGVAALVLSVNPDLTATQVRVLMQHSTDFISTDVARYDAITGHSTEYAYGRINALKAVTAAQQSVSNGDLTWPDIASDIGIDASTMSWTAGSESDEFLVVQSNNVFAFVPVDGACYDRSQAGCDSADIVDLPSDVSVVFAGCDGSCTSGNAQAVAITRPTVGSATAAIYARNTVTGRYSYGSRVRVDAARAPSVVINVSPLSGDSPLEVTFQGNAVSDLEIDDSRTSWDFDTSDGLSTDSADRTTSHTYTVDAGLERVFTARLTMYDVDGNDGIAEVSIRVQGPAVQSTGVDGGPADLAVVVGVPGSPGSDVTGGKSPLSVELSVKATSITGVLQAVSWDLGDGERATGLVIPHTYVNGGTDSLRVPITATVTTATDIGQIISTVAFKVIDVDPGEDEVNIGEPDLPGTTPIGGTSSGLGTCGATGMIPLAFLALTLMGLRFVRRRK